MSKMKELYTTLLEILEWDYAEGPTPEQLHEALQCAASGLGITDVAVIKYHYDTLYKGRH